MKSKMKQTVDEIAKEADGNQIHKQIAGVINVSSQITGFAIGSPITLPVIGGGLIGIYLINSIFYAVKAPNWGIRQLGRIWENTAVAIDERKKDERRKFRKGDIIEMITEADDAYGCSKGGSVGSITHYSGDSQYGVRFTKLTGRDKTVPQEFDNIREEYMKLIWRNQGEKNDG